VAQRVLPLKLAVTGGGWAMGEKHGGGINGDYSGGRFLSRTGPRTRSGRVLPANNRAGEFSSRCLVGGGKMGHFAHGSVRPREGGASTDRCSAGGNGTPVGERHKNRQDKRNKRKKRKELKKKKGGNKEKKGEETKGEPSRKNGDKEN